ncbi:Anaerobic ribonucleotide-triphosphate reductase [Methanothermobacter wolfeii]|uniref:anaerobic ribonucleoside-triphosphate reductase n=1 Tax=Methanothermobacter wolfeii TaxID=145261 RepID=UPI00092DB972|nr:Anaerobic ribonucleotide-triphosphate reductase [Methanothermobacter wolfeii]
MIDDSRLLAAIPTKAETCVLKNNGIREKFSHEKLVKSLLNLGASLWTSENVASEVARSVYNGITTKEIKILVYDSLRKVDEDLADRYLAANRLRVRTSRDKIETFDQKKIEENLIREAGASPEVAEEIASEVWKELKKLNVEYLTAPMIREVVNTKLIEHGLETLRKRYTRLGIPVYNIANLIENGSRDNANMIHNPETVHKYVADEALKQYTLLHILPSGLADAHMSGDIHIHDLEFFAARPLNCLQHDLRLFIRHGLRVDGTGDHTSVAGPPKHLETLMNHAGEIMLASQQNMSGGQAMSLWNVFVAPFAAGLPYEKIKQAVQMFIFNLNMAYAARGSQVPFTSINLEFGVPEFLEDEPAYGPRGERAGVYGDFADEARLLTRAFTEVLLEGDADGKPHLFPNTIYSIRRETLSGEFDEELRLVHELASKYGTAYFINMLADYRGDMANYMGCRTSLADNWTGDWDRDCLRTGNLAYVTLNLPRIAYQSGDDDELFEYLDEYIDMAVEVLRIRREQGLRCLNDYHLLPFLSQEIDGERYYRVENATMSFGFTGLNEMLQYHTGSGIQDPNSNRLGLRVIEHINERAAELKAETGWRWSVLQTPAESTAHRFAMLDHEHYPEEAVLQGTRGAYYYTNSSHTPVDAEVDIIEKIKIEEKYHPLTPGGHIFNAWLGEARPDPEALEGLTRKICRNSDIGFWAYSNALSFCLRCKTLMRGLQDSCAACGERDDVEWYDRITGYVQQVGRAKSSSGGWNRGKQQELLDRRRINL